MDTQETEPVDQDQENPETPQSEQTEVRSDAEYVQNEAQRRVDFFLRDAVDREDRLDLISRKIKKQLQLVETSEEDERSEIAAIQQWINQEQQVHGSAIYNDALLQRETQRVKGNYIKYREQSPVILNILTRTKESMTGNAQPEIAAEPIAEPVIELAEEPTDNTEPIVLTEEITPPSETPADEPLVMSEAVLTEKKQAAELEDEQHGKEEITEQKEIKLDIEDISEKMHRNRQLAEDLRGATARLRSIARDTSSREPWYRPLQSFDEEYIGKLNNRLANILDEAGRLHNVNRMVEENDPQAAVMLNKINEELSHNWRGVEGILDDATDFANRLRRRTNDLLNGDMDHDNPVWQVGSRLRQATEELESRKRML